MSSEPEIAGSSINIVSPRHGRPSATALDGLQGKTEIEEVLGPTPPHAVGGADELGDERSGEARENEAFVSGGSKNREEAGPDRR